MDRFKAPDEWPDDTVPCGNDDCDNELTVGTMAWAVGDQFFCSARCAGVERRIVLW